MEARMAHRIVYDFSLRRLFLYGDGNLHDKCTGGLCRFGALHDAAFLTLSLGAARSSNPKSLYQCTVGFYVFIAAGPLPQVQRFASCPPQG